MQPACNHENSTARELDWLVRYITPSCMFFQSLCLVQHSVFWTLESVVMRVPELEGFPARQNSRQSTMFLSVWSWFADPAQLTEGRAQAQR